MVYLPRAEKLTISGMELTGKNASKVYTGFHQIAESETGGKQVKCFESIVLEAMEKRKMKG